MIGETVRFGYVKGAIAGMKAGERKGYRKGYSAAIAETYGKQIADMGPVPAATAKKRVHLKRTRG